MFGWRSKAETDEDNRRRDARLEHHDRTVAVTIDETRAPMKLKNVSTRGASGEVAVPVAPGQAVVVEFESGLKADGIVRNVTGARIGIEFAACIPLDVVEGAALARKVGKRRHYPRLSLERQVHLLINGLRYSGTVRNVSQGGALIEAAVELIPGQQVIIEWNEAEAQPGNVRWSDGWKAGVMFAVPVTPSAR